MIGFGIVNCSRNADFSSESSIESAEIMENCPWKCRDNGELPLKKKQND